ncbi:MAG: ATP-binding cassette domain-containing protein [Oscillatoriales cyanobacterium SM2_3_0]|nr:ATP-binding cassette domain-containing protein [Oscillatoriales cyanobacterium SM2_3_0]
MAEQQRFKANSLAFALQLTRGIGQLRIAAAEERAFGFWERQYNQQLKLILAQQILQDRSRLFQQIIPTLGLIALLGWGIPLVQSSLPLGSRPLSTGTFLAFYVAFGALMGGVVSLGNNILDGLGAVALWQQVKPLFSLRPEIYSSQSDPGKLRGYLKFDQVSFRYDSGRALVLNRVTLEAQPGEFVAIVGTPGSGKSTLVRLLLGFEVPESGAIYYDGQDLSRLNPATVRSQLGVVLQHGRIYQGTILENIAGRTLASMDEVWAAASMAGLVDEINRMPMGLHTVVSEGGINLSGGLQQQLLIARALVSQPQIIIFDEATNSLDYRTQQIVARSLEQLKITRIVIAHHASVIRNADRIYLLDGGHVVQQGHFTELMQEQELFRKMFKNMFKDQVSDSAGETEP